MRTPTLSLTALVLVLSACSQPAENSPAGQAQTEQAAQSVDTSPPAIRPVDVPTKGGDGSPIELATLGAADISGARLAGELGCSFVTEATADPILIAKGNVASDDPSRGIVKIGTTVERISASGGYDAMARGTKFYAKGIELRVAPTAPATGGGESPPRPAMLTADRADGAQRIFAGLWQCGP